MPRTRRDSLTVLLASLLALVTIGGGLPAAQPVQQATPSFAAEIARLSEPEGHFDTDNLVSNEQTYLHALDSLRQLGVFGGVYLGVGPDQNFSYIAQIRPTRAYIVDIRRDNLLEHLLFKALFSVSPTRVEYVARLFGRPRPPSAEWDTADVERLVAYIDETPATEGSIERSRAEVDAEIQRYGVPLSASDRATIARFHRTFIKRGLSLRFHSTGRPPRPYYPTYRNLLLATDGEGVRSSYLAASASYQFLRSLQRRDLIIPVVGNLAGHHSIRAIGETIAALGERVSVFYTSNVEFYLFRNGTAEPYLENLAHLPRDERSVVVRSVFGQALGSHPSGTGSRSYSAPVVQQIEDIVDGFATTRYRGYWDLVR